jgi:phage protein D/phage baseplate assembly protein gpV
MPKSELLSQMPFKIGGQDAPRNMMRAVREIVVDTSLHLPHMFTIQLDDDTLHWIDDPLLEIGSSMEISGKAEGESQSTQLITKGEITSIEPELIEDTGSTVIIRGYDKSHRLHRGKKTRTFLNMKDSDIVSKIARECGLQPQVDNTTQVYDHVFQDYQTDMEFIRDRAQRAGFFTYVEDGKLNFCQRPKASGQGPVLEWGQNLLSFQARFTTAEQVNEAEVHGWNAKQKQAIIGKSSSPRGTPTVNSESHGGKAAQKAFSMASGEVVNNRPVGSQGEADALAQSILDERCHAFFHAEGTCTGNPAVRAGAEVELKGIGKRFSGRYQVTRAVHRYDLSGYTTEFEISGHRANTLGQLLATNGHQGYGVVVGIVTNLNDPEGLARVKVKYPTISEDLESHWARLVTPMAGAGRGFEFIPEVNDEVLVAFEYDDINKPYILGSLWNGQDKPPENSKDIAGNGKVQKRIIHSRSGHKITLDDTDGGEKISIVDKSGKNLIEIGSSGNTLEVKAGKKVEIHTDDGHKIVLDGSGINIEAGSAKDLKLKAQNIKIEAAMGVDMKANSNVTIEGNMTAVKGKASMDLDGGAKLTAKGAMVMIN